jgi:hypothetical protein
LRELRIGAWCRHDESIVPHFETELGCEHAARGGIAVQNLSLLIEQEHRIFQPIENGSWIER